MGNLKYISAVVIVFIICLTILISTLILSNGSFYIKNLGSNIQNGTMANTINVSGDGKVFVKPDIANLSVTATELSSTSEAALDGANSKISNVIDVAVRNGVNKEDIQTTGLNVYTEYDYTNGGSVLKGQRATITVNIKVKNLDEKAQKASKIIDEVSKIDKIQLGSISFDIEDKTKAFSQARVLAFEKAKQKAEELSRLGAVKLVKPVSISDTVTDISTGKQSINVNYDLAAPIAPSANSTSIATGQLEVSVTLNVMWGIE